MVVMLLMQNRSFVTQPQLSFPRAMEVYARLCRLKMASNHCKVINPSSGVHSGRLADSANVSI